MSIVVLALTGAMSSAVLLAAHDGGWRLGGDAGSSYLLQLCTSRALPSLRCAEVVGSRWGSFDFHVGGRRFLVPLSFVGFSYFVTLVIWITFTGFPGPSGRRRSRITLAAVALGVGVSAALVGVMSLSLHRWCPLCVIAHTANFAILVLMIAGYRRMRPSARLAGAAVPAEHREASGTRPAALALATSVAFVVGAWLLFESTIEMRRYWRQAHGLKQAIKAMQEDADLTMREFLAQTPQTVPSRELQFDDPRPTMVVFRSFDSDASACFEQEWREAHAAAVGDALRIEYRDTPIALVQAFRRGEPLDEAGTASARAVEAARLQDDEAAYGEFVALLFRARGVDGAIDFSALAARAGLDAPRFRQDMGSDRVRHSVEADIALAASLGIDHTPVIFIEGRRVPNLCVKSDVFWETVGRTPGLTESVAECGPASGSEVSASFANHAQGPR